VTRTLAAAVLAATLLAAGCGGGDETATPKDVVLVTHDSFVMPKQEKAAFERESGYTLRILQGGDAGEALNRALLTAGDPQGDVLFGVDDNLLSRALAEDLFEPYTSGELEAVQSTYASPDEHVTPVDHGEVCLNIDRGWFAKRGLAPPAGLAQLTAPRYKGLLVVENAATSSPGLAFLFATVARYGEQGWQDYWRKLVANDVAVVDGWEEAYTQQFSGAAGSPGKRPIVVSYATSPPAEVIFGGKKVNEAPTAAIEDGCFRQVEYAGILRGAHNEKGAQELIDFLLSERFQAGIPETMFVYPVREGVTLPEAFTTYGIQPASPLTLTPEEIEQGRDRWIDQWTQIVVR
jgi:thiamine transport system substrate-binding protein